jgi:fluoride ion exporter CrcB/FEX
MEERERLFWVLGFLGSFTTFSSFMLQSVESWAFSPALGVLYGGGSILSRVARGSARVEAREDAHLVVSAPLTLLGAGFGAVIRYVLGGWINHKTGPESPGEHSP